MNFIIRLIGRLKMPTDTATDVLQSPPIALPTCASIMGDRIGSWGTVYQKEMPVESVDIIGIGKDAPIDLNYFKENLDIHTLGLTTRGAIDMTELKLKTPLKHKVYFKSKKRNQVINQLPDDEQSKKPQFIRENIIPVFSPVRNPWFKCGRNKLAKEMTTDADLVNMLKMEAAFVPRTPALLQQLKHKGKKILDQFDMSLYTNEDKYNMLIRAVGAAMLVSEEEERVRAILQSRHEREYLRPMHQQFLASGLGNVGSTKPVNPRPGKACVRGSWVSRTLTNAIVF